MKITEIELPWTSLEESSEFSIGLPKNARVQSVYLRDARFYFLITYEETKEIERRDFFVHQCDCAHGGAVSELLTRYRYIGGDEHLGTTCHFFETLKGDY